MKNYFLKFMLVLGVFALAAVFYTPAADAALARKVSAHLVFWDQSRGFQDIQNNVGVFSEISPFWYTLDSSGNVVPYKNGASYEDPNIVSYLHSNGILVLPAIANALNGSWNGPLVSNLINNPSLSATHITNIVNLVVSKGYDGIDLDYEALLATDRTAFSKFVTDLASALHAKGKLLSVNVYAKTSEPGTWDGPQAQDWSVIGQTADEVRIMIYDYHWSTSPPGAISPIWWVDNVLAFAVTKIPRSKIMQGVPLYGYDWVGSSAVDRVWQDTIAIARTYGATINWDSTSATPWFKYVASGITHEVWFENASSTDAKLALTNKYDVSGVNFWRLGGEDPGTWQVTRNRFTTITPPPPPPTTDTTSPTVSITSPLEGATLSNSQTISASASDNVTVAKVEFYVDGSLLATDTNAPYEVTWNTRKVANGAHVIKAVAYDTSGNSAFDEVTAYKGASPPTTDTTPPTVAITFPLNGTILETRQKIEATAADNVGVTKVEFYIDGALFSTSKSSPYVTTWNTRKASAGAHTIKAVAYDAAGNTASAEITVYKSSSAEGFWNKFFGGIINLFR